MGREFLNTVFNEEGLGFQLSHTLRKIHRDLKGKKNSLIKMREEKGRTTQESAERSELMRGDDLARADFCLSFVVVVTSRTALGEFF